MSFSTGFPMKGNFYISLSHEYHTWTIKIHHGDTEIVKASGSSKRIALDRAWDALQAIAWKNGGIGDVR